MRIAVWKLRLENLGFLGFPKESILQEWLLVAKLCADFTLKHRWAKMAPQNKNKCFTLNMVA